ncbi:MAG: methylmalonyl-CoA mutase [Candidatus Sungiibacteriota bacterium]|uniref:Methylmalonyl-CoA mutase n=1 Tax=Candidatus Sungiibacteriota bacterium TaxID=2750080 RepID=A0A7T5RKB7_9BACT|nr:MAG: methylmalonyl-CoA mutase [Candidatus Sungbacteria bacterium]
MPQDTGFLRPDELPDLLANYLENLNDPGKFPFTRGIYPSMYRGKKPTLRQFAGHGLAQDTNERFKTILGLGGGGLSVAFDLPTLMGKDPDDPLSLGTVGSEGVAVTTLYDMEKLFEGIPIDQITVSMTINAPAPIIFAMYIVAAEKRGVARALLGGTIQNDILKEYIAQKEWLFPVEKGVKFAVDPMEFCARHMPKWHPVSISGYHIREAGSNALQELAYTLADGMCYVEKCLARGLRLEEFAPRLSFFFDVHNNFFEEIAKLRASRRLWAKILRERYHAPLPESYENTKDPRLQSLWCRIHAQTAGCTLTLQEPMNNIVRVAYQALAAILGGAQSVHTNSFDEVICTPTEKALRLAIRTQQILVHETEICDWVDPLGGSWLVESLTDKLEQKAREEIALIYRNHGGMEGAVKASYPQRQIAREAYYDQRRVERGERKVIGVNTAVNITQEDELADVRRELQKRRGFEELHIENVRRIRAERSQEAVARALDEIRRAAETNLNLMPVLIEAVKTYATLGEICHALQDVWGSYQERETPY